MAILVECDTKETANIHLKIAEWIKSCQKCLGCVYNRKPCQLTVSEALQGNPGKKICDPYGFISELPLSKKVESIETENGKPFNRESNISGNLIVKLNTGEELSGRWVAGGRDGQGALCGPRLDKIGVESIVGEYEDGILTGKGKVIMKDQSVREGWFQHGYFHGPTRGCLPTGELNYIGSYHGGIPHGMVWRRVQGGGWVVGRVDSQGNHSGPDIAFLYPNFTTALFGEFYEGILVRASEARITNLEKHEGILCPSFEVISERPFCYWPSTAEDIQCPPLQEDPYESTMLAVGPAHMDGGGEELFAKRDIPTGVLVTYYNGIRMKAGEKSPYDDTGYAIFVEWNRDSKDGHNKGEHMDLPPQYHNSAAYRATLAHKINHSFTPNCSWTNADHPCLGFLPSVTTIQEVKAGEELNIHYMMDMENAPDWYMECWDCHTTYNNI